MAPQRMSARDRGYTSAWEKAAAGHLARHPNCALCAKRGIVTPATLVHHTVRHRFDWKIFWDKSKWESSCKPCHDGPHQADEKRIERGLRPITAAGADGWPV